MNSNLLYIIYMLEKWGVILAIGILGTFFPQKGK